MSTIPQINTSLYAQGGASSRLAAEFESVHAEGLALGAEDSESSFAGAGKDSELLPA